MALGIGIVGLPNVGKSTTFNALTQAQNAEVANYPFCTIQPNKAVVPVPDARLEQIASRVEHDSVQHATVEFVDIAGLVRGASRGEGLGNQFLGNIRETAAIIHVVRCFDDPNVVHVSAQPDPVSDIEVVNLELALADLEQIERRLEKLTREVKGDRKLQPVLELALELKAALEEGRPVSAHPAFGGDAFQTLQRELRFLTAKPVIYLANVDEAGLAEDNAYAAAVRGYAAAHGAEFVKLCAEMENELAGMSAEDRAEFLELAGVAESGLDQVIRQGYHALELISFFTTDSRQLRAWTVRRGWTAPKAAGAIHTDFERGFIRAETLHYDAFMAHGGEAAARAAGALRIEGRDYVVQDGDIIHFRFHV